MTSSDWTLDDIALIRAQLSSPFRDGLRKAVEALDHLEEQLRTALAQLAEIEEQAPPTPEEWHRLNEQVQVLLDSEAEWQRRGDRAIAAEKERDELKEQLQTAEQQRDDLATSNQINQDALASTKEQLEAVREALQRVSQLDQDADAVSADHALMEAGNVARAALESSPASRPKEGA